MVLQFFCDLNVFCKHSPHNQKVILMFTYLIMTLEMSQRHWEHLSLSRLVLYIEREMRSVTRVKKNLKHSAYLSECLNSLVVHLSNTASLILGTHTHTHTHPHTHTISVIFVKYWNFNFKRYLISCVLSPISRGHFKCITKCHWEKGSRCSSVQKA